MDSTVKTFRKTNNDLIVEAILNSNVDLNRFTSWMQLIGDLHNEFSLTYPKVKVVLLNFENCENFNLDFFEKFSQTWTYIEFFAYNINYDSLGDSQEKITKSAVFSKAEKYVNSSTDKDSIYFASLDVLLDRFLISCKDIGFLKYVSYLNSTKNIFERIFETLKVNPFIKVFIVSCEYTSYIDTAMIKQFQEIVANTGSFFCIDFCDVSNTLLMQNLIKTKFVATSDSKFELLKKVEQHLLLSFITGKVLEEPVNIMQLKTQLLENGFLQADNQNEDPSDDLSEESSEKISDIKSDAYVQKAPHYQDIQIGNEKYEAWEIIIGILQHLNLDPQASWYLGDALKYILRIGKKFEDKAANTKQAKTIQDIGKSIYYLNKVKETLL